MGKRTKFQVDSKPQLRVAEATSSEGTTTKVAVPESSELNEDSVLLEDVAFDDQKRRANVQDPRRAALTSCVALALCLDVRNTNPDDGLTNDQMRPYVAFALASPVDWLVHSAALLQRCRIEAHSVYSADRAALQLEVLANQHVSQKPGDASPQDRIAFASCVDYPSRWELDGEVAHAMARLGAFVSAAERFKKIHEWDLVIELYAAAGRREDALEVLNRELEQKPDHPRLLCALGDLRDDATLHERAWTKSECRDWRAARSLARRHMNKGRWSEACAWYDETVKIRPQASQSWFDLGCCRMRLADSGEEKAQLGKAARAFSRCVQHEPDCGDAWANLAACRLRSGQAAMAKNALDRAVATRPEDWRLWENLSRCCCMLRRTQEAMVSINRLLDLSMVSKRPVGAILDVILRVMELVDEESDESFNSQRAREVLDELCLRLDTEAPAGADRASATLWSALAERADDVVTCRVRRAKAVRAYLNAEGLEREEKLLEGLSNAALALSRSMDAATAKERASTALLLRSVAARVNAATCEWAAKDERVGAITGAADGLEAAA
jgi:tetratricopeptide (TPR) repeat protein